MSDQRTLPKDANDYPIPTGKKFMTEDGTAIPQTSPLTVSGTIIEIVVPARAAELIIVDVSEDLKVSEKAAMGSYFTVSQNEEGIFGVMEMDSIYVVRAGSVDSDMQFYFNLL